ncbi:hypothetical protein GGI20_002512 [Coemansia sp. BCRC 34301]|nr:hypothetical protein GGI20_002512 [Coemansia sp. BCRC 34301]
MDRPGAPTAGYGSRPQYEREKERLIVEINQCMDTVNRNLVQLNQNLESAISLGSSFNRIASLWGEFGTIISPPVDEDGGGGGGGCGGGSNDESSVSGDEAYANEVDEAPADDYKAEDDDDSRPGYESESPMDEDL